MHPWLSVIVPVYNGERYLAAALESIFHQTAEMPGQVEVVVSDDGSSDRSPVIISSFSSFGPVKVIDGPRLRNWVANSNFAARHASGRYLTFLHQDDIWLPGRLHALRRSVEHGAIHSLWISPCRFIGPSGRDCGAWRLPFGSIDCTVDPNRFLEQLLVQNFIGMPAPMFSKMAFEAVGGMDESLWYTADWDLWLRLGRLGPVRANAAATAAFRIHNESQTVRGSSAFETMRLQTNIVLQRHLSAIADPARRNVVGRAGRLSTELNAALAAVVGRRIPSWRDLAISIALAGPGGFYRFARNARFLERSSARIRAGLGLK